MSYKTYWELVVEDITSNNRTGIYGVHRTELINLLRTMEVTRSEAYDELMNEMTDDEFRSIGDLQADVCYIQTAAIAFILTTMGLMDEPQTNPDANAADPSAHDYAGE